MGLENEFSIYVDDNISFCVEIAENFAIGFAEWCNSNYGLDRTTWVKYVDGKFNRYTTKELLEIYKKTL